MHFFRNITIIFVLFTFILLISTSQRDAFILFERKEENEYKAITYNIHRGTSKYGIPSFNQIATLLKKENPDFIALQEVDRYHIRSGFYDQIKWVASQLNMYYVYGKNMNYGIIEYGNAILSKYPIIDWGKIELAYETEPRSLLWAKVNTEHGNVIITSVHLGLDTKKRAEHFTKIEAFLKDFEEPLLLMGDFNVLPNNQTFLQFRTNMTGCFLYENIPTYIRDHQPIQIDYIISRDIKEIDMYSIPSNASDHYPLILKFFILPDAIKKESTIRII